MVETKIIIIDKTYIPEEEYNKLDDAMFIDYEKSDYGFVSAIYDKGVIIYVLGRSNLDQKTKEDFPNLFKLLEFCRERNFKYIDLFRCDEIIDPRFEKKFNLKRFDYSDE